MSHPEIIIVPSLFASVAYIVWVLANTYQRKQRIRLLTDFHSRLLDRIGSVKDFGELMQTDAGSRFLIDLTSEPTPTSGAKERILRATQIGVVLICLGIGMMALPLLVAIPGDVDGFTITGCISLSLGIGFVLSAIASYRLSGALGLLDRAAPHSTTPAPTHG
ncbi:MAG: hypothetical protein QM736_24360 [Vicinamibacterales bacterium]